MKMFHGGCHGCTMQNKFGISYCSGCQFSKANWDLPNLNDKDAADEKERDRIISQGEREALFYGRLTKYWNNIKVVFCLFEKNKMRIINIKTGGKDFTSFRGRILYAKLVDSNGDSVCSATLDYILTTRSGNVSNITNYGESVAAYVQHQESVMEYYNETLSK